MYGTPSEATHSLKTREKLWLPIGLVTSKLLHVCNVIDHSKNIAIIARCTGKRTYDIYCDAFKWFACVNGHQQSAILF